MIAPVPYTPKAIQLIRKGASAADLGWAESRFDGVCRLHGIEQHKPKAEVVAPKEGRPALIIDFNHRSGEIIRASIIIALSPVQAEVFGILYERYRDGDQNFMSAFDISGKLKKECSTRNVVNMMARMNARLDPLKCWIEGKLGPNGGYRLRVDP